MSPNHYRDIAPHLRARVYTVGRGLTGRTKWALEVVNTRTGRVVAYDDCTDWHNLINLADHATGAARAAWFWDFRRGAVK